MKQVKLTVLLVAGLTLNCPVQSSELVYQPVNPNFGGNPLNGNYLLGNAQAQNKKTDPDSGFGGSTFERPSDLDRLTSSLESRLLSQLLSDVESGSPGRLETGDFIVEILDDSGALSINITDKITGDTSIIEVSGLNASN